VASLSFTTLIGLNSGCVTLFQVGQAGRMSNASESPKGYRYPKLVIGHWIYLYHRLLIELGLSL
jgi:hypothetical protein